MLFTLIYTNFICQYPPIIIIVLQQNLVKEGEEEEDEVEEEEVEEDKELCFAVFHGCFVEINLFLVNVFFLCCRLMKLKFKSEFSLVWAYLINHSNPYIHSTTVLCESRKFNSIERVKASST